MGKEGRRFLPNLKKLGSPRLNLDELVYEIEQKSKNMGLVPDEDTSNENVHIHEDGEIHFEPH